MAMDMRGALNLSQYYKKPNQPKYYGKCLIEGKEWVVKGWEKEGPKGPWISLLFEEPLSEEEKTAKLQREFAPDPKPRPAYREYDNVDNPGYNDDVPF